MRWMMTLALMTFAACGAADTPPDTPAPQESGPDEPIVDGVPEDDEVVVEDLEPINPEAAPHSLHHRLALRHNEYVGASVEVRVDDVPRHGLRFFALQVNFADVAWAHGGLQADPEDGKANWGGLVSGIDYDFEGAELEVLSAVQNMPGRTSPADWEEDTWYRYDVRRGELTELPPGEYSVLSEDPVMVENAREMWEWSFSITNVGTGEVVWENHLYVAHPVITSATYWTETGYGIECTDKLTVKWRNPFFEREDGTSDLPHMIKKSMRQSDCPNSSTTDMAAADNGGEWGTVQFYGVERRPNSEDGDVLYLKAFGS